MFPAVHIFIWCWPRSIRKNSWKWIKRYLRNFFRRDQFFFSSQTSFDEEKKVLSSKVLRLTKYEMITCKILAWRKKVQMFREWSLHPNTNVLHVNQLTIDKKNAEMDSNKHASRTPTDISYHTLRYLNITCWPHDPRQDKKEDILIFHLELNASTVVFI